MNITLGNFERFVVCTLGAFGITACGDNPSVENALEVDVVEPKIEALTAFLNSEPFNYFDTSRDRDAPTSAKRWLTGHRQRERDDFPLIGSVEILPYLAGKVVTLSRPVGGDWEVDPMFRQLSPSLVPTSYDEIKTVVLMESRFEPHKYSYTSLYVEHRKLLFVDLEIGRLVGKLEVWRELPGKIAKGERWRIPSGHMVDLVNSLERKRDLNSEPFGSIPALNLNHSEHPK